VIPGRGEGIDSCSMSPQPAGMFDIVSLAHWWYNAYKADRLASRKDQTAAWVVMFEHSHGSRMETRNGKVTVLEVGTCKLNFQPPQGAFATRRQSGRRNVRE